MQLEPCFLAPGEFWCGQQQQAELMTVLGSCIAVVLWQPQYQFMALCHYVLPGKPGQLPPVGTGVGYYGATILPHLLDAAQHRGFLLNTLRISVIGGAELASSEKLPQSYRVGRNNARYALSFFIEQQLAVQQQDTGGKHARSLTVNTVTGAIKINLLPATLQGAHDR